MPGEDFATALAERVSHLEIEVRTVACLNLCDTPMSLALRGVGKTAYLFSDVAASDVGDAAALAGLYVAAQDGEITDARAAGRLRHCLVGKIPAI
ncbi:hypothetical protein NBRC116601_23410 [Cognatishimia sp. WU-CL00825]